MIAGGLIPSHVSDLRELAIHLLEREHIDREWFNVLCDQCGVDETIEAYEADAGRLRDTLVNFGALAEDDTTTGPLDLLEVLLPAGGDGG